MSDNELAIIVVAIVFGSVLGIVVISKLAGLIKAWINRNKNSYDEEKFERLAKAFIQHKKSTERRLKSLETDDGKKKSSSISDKPTKEDRLQNKVQIEPKEEQAQPTTGGGNLNNMLRNEQNSP
jgi:hypothetical protein